MDAGTMLKPALARGELQLIGATTLEEYRRHIEKDAALERRFEPVRCPSRPSSRPWRSSAGCGALRDPPRRQITDAALQAAAELSDRYVRDRFLPDKAIDLSTARPPGRGCAPRTDAAPRQQVEQLRRARDVAVDAEDYERADGAHPRAGGARRTAPPLSKKPRDHRRRHRRDGGAAHRHPGRRAGAAERDRLLRLEEPAPARRRAGRGRRGGRRRRARAAGPGSATPGGRSARSCSSAPPASARPSWPGRWPRRCSARPTSSCGSTCRSTPTARPSPA